MVFLTGIPLLRCFARAGRYLQNCRSGLHRPPCDLTTRTGGVESNEILSHPHFDSVIRDGVVCAKLFLPTRKGTNPLSPSLTRIQCPFCFLSGAGTGDTRQSFAQTAS